MTKALTTPHAAPRLSYRVSVRSLHAHLFAVALRIDKPSALQRVSLPVWIAGSYLLREFSRHLQGLRAHQGEAERDIQQIDKCTWQIDCAPDQALLLHYEVYAFDASVRTAWLDVDRGFFNGTSLCLQVHGQSEQAHQLHLVRTGLPSHWQAATALTAQKVLPNGFGTYVAANYDELVDSPVELGRFWSGNFIAGGIRHRVVVAGATDSFDAPRLVRDMQAVCEAELRFWHGAAGSGRGRAGKSPAPHSHYLFMLSAVDHGYGGLEHRHSTALICKRSDLPRIGQSTLLAASDGYTILLGLISHEYFHTWNVKRLRPAAFAHYDYARENYTDMLWFFEGFTSYFDDLLLRRAKLIDDATYLTLLGKTINQVLQTPGRKLQSVAQASFDAWIKYYRQDENTANTTISYYTKGALVALCLDLSLRHSGNTNLDAVMRGLWQHCHAGPMTQDDLLAVLKQLSGQCFAQRLAQWVYGTADLPLQDLLQNLGVAFTFEKAGWADQLGLRFSEQNGLTIKTVLRDSPAEQAGFAAGDEWLGVEVGRGKTTKAWRMNKLDDLSLYLADARSFKALVARDRRLHTLDVTFNDHATLVKLGVNDAAVISQWLD